LPSIRSAHLTKQATDLANSNINENEKEGKHRHVTALSSSVATSPASPRTSPLDMTQGVGGGPRPHYSQDRDCVPNTIQLSVSGSNVGGKALNLLGARQRGDAGGRRCEQWQGLIGVPLMPGIEENNLSPALRPTCAGVSPSHLCAVRPRSVPDGPRFQSTTTRTRTARQ
jgi:hypothetical protein